MTTLALDLGTTTGWAYATPRPFPSTTSKIDSGTWSLKPGKYDGAGMRGVKFMGYLDTLHRRSPLSLIVFEAVRRHIGTDAAHCYGGLMMILQTWGELNQVPHAGVSVQAIKKFWTGKGNAKKDAMIAACRERGFAPGDDNEADAIALLHLQMEGNHG